MCEDARAVVARCAAVRMRAGGAQRRAAARHARRRGGQCCYQPQLHEGLYRYRFLNIDTLPFITFLSNIFVVVGLNTALRFACMPAKE